MHVREINEQEPYYISSLPIASKTKHRKIKKKEEFSQKAMNWKFLNRIFKKSPSFRFPVDFPAKIPIWCSGVGAEGRRSRASWKSRGQWLLAEVIICRLALTNINNQLFSFQIKIRIHTNGMGIDVASPLHLTANNILCIGEKSIKLDKGIYGILSRKSGLEIILWFWGPSRI